MSFSDEMKEFWALFGKWRDRDAKWKEENLYCGSWYLDDILRQSVAFKHQYNPETKMISRKPIELEAVKKDGKVVDYKVKE